MRARRGRHDKRPRGVLAVNTRSSKRNAYCQSCGCQLGERIIGRGSILVGKRFCADCWDVREGRTRVYMTKDEACALVGVKVGDE